MASEKVNKLDFDPYLTLGLDQDATEAEVTKAYKKSALKWHPDKNPDNVKFAQEMFIKLSRAFEYLTDPAVRAAYDALKKARAANREKLAKYDAKRRKFREELEARESGYLNKQQQEAKATRDLEKEIERLRREGSKLLQRERENIEREVHSQTAGSSCDIGSQGSASGTTSEEFIPRLRLKWKVNKGATDNAGYDEQVIRSLFQKFGSVAAVVISKKAGSAIVEFEKRSAAELALQSELGLEGNLLRITWLVEPPKCAQVPSATTASRDGGQQPDACQNLSADDFMDFEAKILADMERKHKRDVYLRQMEMESAEQNVNEECACDDEQDGGGI